MTWSFATITAIEIGGGGEPMHLCCGPFRWPWRCAGAIQSALPNAAWPGRLHRKPLDAAIGQLLTPYCPSAARATINLTMMQHVLNLLAISMAIAMRRYYTTHIARWRRFVAFIKATKRHHRTSTRSDIIKGTHPLRLFRTFHREEELQLTCWPLITIGVWHIKLTRST